MFKYYINKTSGSEEFLWWKILAGSPYSHHRGVYFDKYDRRAFTGFNDITTKGW